MIEIEQIAVEVEVPVLARLDRGIGRVFGPSAWRKVHLGKQAEGRQCHLGQTLGGELMIIDDHLLNSRVRGLFPMGLQRRRHVDDELLAFFSPSRTKRQCSSESLFS